MSNNDDDDDDDDDNEIAPSFEEQIKFLRKARQVGSTRFQKTTEFNVSRKLRRELIDVRIDQIDQAAVDSRLEAALNRETGKNIFGESMSGLVGHRIQGSPPPPEDDEFMVGTARQDHEPPKNTNKFDRDDDEGYVLPSESASPSQGEEKEALEQETNELEEGYLESSAEDVEPGQNESTDKDTDPDQYESSQDNAEPVPNEDAEPIPFDGAAVNSKPVLYELTNENSEQIQYESADEYSEPAQYESTDGNAEPNQYESTEQIVEPTQFESTVESTDGIAESAQYESTDGNAEPNQYESTEEIVEPTQFESTVESTDGIAESAQYESTDGIVGPAQFESTVESTDGIAESAQYESTDGLVEPAQYEFANEHSEPAQHESTDGSAEPAQYESADKHSESAPYESTDGSAEPAQYESADEHSEPAQYEPTGIDVASVQFDIDTAQAQFESVDRDGAHAQFESADIDSALAQFESNDEIMEPAQYAAEYEAADGIISVPTDKPAGPTIYAPAINAAGPSISVPPRESAGPTASTSPGKPPAPTISVPPSKPPAPTISVPPSKPPGPTASASPGKPPGPIISAPSGKPPGPIISAPPGKPPAPTISVPPSKPPGPTISAPPGKPPGPIISAPPGKPPGPIISAPPGKPPGPITSAPPSKPLGPTVSAPPSNPAGTASSAPATKPGGLVISAPAKILPEERVFLPENKPSVVPSDSESKAISQPISQSIASRLPEAQQRQTAASLQHRPELNNFSQNYIQHALSFKESFGIDLELDSSNTIHLVLHAGGESLKVYSVDFSEAGLEEAKIFSAALIEQYIGVLTRDFGIEIGQPGEVAVRQLILVPEKQQLIPGKTLLARLPRIDVLKALHRAIEYSWPASFQLDDQLPMRVVFVDDTLIEGDESGALLKYMEDGRPILFVSPALCLRGNPTELDASNDNFESWQATLMRELAWKSAVDCGKFPLKPDELEALGWVRLMTEEESFALKTANGQLFRPYELATTPEQTWVRCNESGELLNRIGARTNQIKEMSFLGINEMASRASVRPIGEHFFNTEEEIVDGLRCFRQGADFRSYLGTVSPSLYKIAKGLDQMSINRCYAPSKGYAGLIRSNTGSLVDNNQRNQNEIAQYEQKLSKG